MSRVALVGSSLALASLGAVLSLECDLELLRVELPCNGAAARLQAFTPDIVIFELAEGIPDCIHPILAQRPGLGLIGFDLETRKMLLLSGERASLSTADDLVRAVKKLVHGENSLNGTNGFGEQGRLG